jgi:hypothetical protein
MRGNLACCRAGAFVLKGLIAAAWALLILIAGGLAQNAKADVWRDVQTGQSVLSGPVFSTVVPTSTITGMQNIETVRGVRPDPGDCPCRKPYLAGS